MKSRWRKKEEKRVEEATEIESTNVCNLVVLDTWCMGRLAMENIFHTQSPERYRWCRGSRLAYDTVGIRNGFEFSCAPANPLCSSLSPLSLPFHKFKWNIEHSLLRFDCDKKRLRIYMCFAKIIAYHFSLLLLVVIIVGILHNVNKSARVPVDAGRGRAKWKCR